MEKTEKEMEIPDMVQKCIRELTLFLQKAFINLWYWIKESMDF
jgi:hypothetical protein